MPPLKPHSLSNFFRFVLLLPGLFLLLTGCTPPKPATDPSLDAKALEKARGIEAWNRDIITTKGIGRLVLETNRSREQFRIAWAAQGPDRLRLTLLSSGHPVETIAASGEWVTMISHTGRHKPHNTPSTDPDLNPYIGMPVRLSDLVSLLLGRYPLQPFDRAWFVPESRNRIRTSRSFSGQTQEVEFDPGGQIASISLTDSDGTLVYRIHYREYTKVEGRVMPVKITLTTTAGHTHDLTLLQLYPNVEIKPAVFRLTASGS